MCTKFIQVWGKVRVWSLERQQMKLASHMDQLWALNTCTATPQDSSCWWRTKSKYPPPTAPLQISQSPTNGTLQTSQSPTKGTLLTSQSPNGTLHTSQSPTNSTLQMSQSPTNGTLHTSHSPTNGTLQTSLCETAGFLRNSRLHLYQKMTSRGASSNVRTAGANVFVQKGCYLGVTRVGSFTCPHHYEPELQQLLNPPVYKWNNTRFWNANKLITYGLTVPTYSSRGTTPLEAQHISWPTTWLSTTAVATAAHQLANNLTINNCCSYCYTHSSSQRWNDYQPTRTEFKITETSIREVRKCEAYYE